MPITLSKALAEALHNYLLSRPMREVEQLVFALREAASPPPAPPAKAKRK